MLISHSHQPVKKALGKIMALWALLALGACVNSQKMGRVSPTEIQVDTEQQAKKILEGDQVFCQGECPDSVASFFLYHHSQVGQNGSTRRSVIQCSATLIAADKILTNNHCIEDLLKEGDVLSQVADVSIEIKFPKTKSAPFLSVKAKKILKTSKNFQRRMAPDWAIVQLASVVRNREPVKPAAQDFEDGAAVELFPVFFDDSYEPVAAVIKQVKCRQSFDNPLDIFSGDSESPLFRVIGCDQAIVSGNSGTGVFLSSSGGLMGVLASSAGEPLSASGTMAHCLPNFSAGSDECFYSDDKDYTEISKQMSFLSSFVRERDLSVQDWTVFTGFRFQADQDELEKPPTLEFNAPWTDYLAYLDKIGNQKLKSRFLTIFTRALFPMSPACIEKESLQASLRLPLMNMAVWDLRPFEWKEEVIGADSKSSRITYTPASTSASVMPVSVSATAHGKEFILESTSELPSPIKKFTWRLPVCQ